MKLKLLTLISTICIVLISPANSQEWKTLLPQSKVQNGTLNFYDVQKAFNEYWEPLHVVNGYYKSAGIDTKAGGWKQFKRWEWLMESRINTKTGAFPTTTGFQEFQKTYGNFKAASATGNWSSLGPSSSDGGYAGLGRFNCIAFRAGDNSTYYAGSASGGLWKTTDNGTNWTVLTDENAVLGVSDAIVIAGTSTATDIIYIGTGDRDGGSMWSLNGGQENDNNSVGVLKSSDGGASWQTTGLVFATSQKETVNRMLIDPINNDILYAATSDGLYKTIDAGVNWTKKSSTDFIDIKMNPDHNTILYGSTTSGQIFKSSDSGENWTSVFSVSGYRIELAVSLDNSNYVYALVSNYSDFQAIYRSTDSGDSFLSVFTGTNMMGWNCDGGDSGGQAFYDLCIAADPTDVNTIYIGGVNTWKSIDGGVSWAINTHWSGNCSGTATEVHADKHFLAFQNGTSTLFECNDGGVYKTTDSGNSWTDLTNGTVCSQLYRLGVAQTSPNDIIMGLQDNGTKALSSSTWRDVIGGDGMECLIDYTDVNIQYGELYYGAIYRTDNKWGSSTSISGSLPGGSWVTPFVIDPNEHNTLYAGFSDIWKTTDKGDTWVQLGTIGTSLRSIAVAPSNSNFIYAAATSTVYSTTDGGTNWTNITNSSLSSGAGSITYLVVKNDDPNTVWATMGGYNGDGVFQTTDGGTTWSNISTGLPNIPIMCIVQNKQNTEKVELYVGTDVGVFLKMGNDNWVPFMSDLPNVVVTELDIFYDDIAPQNTRIRAATFGRGLWESETFPSALVLGAAYSASPTSGIYPLTVNFTDESTGTITSRTWDFGDSENSTEQNPSHIYASPGSYTVALTITDANGTDTETKTNYIEVVHPAPTPDFDANPLTGDIPLEVTFTDRTTGAIDTWAWDFGDGNTSILQNPSHIYDLAGSYSIRLITTKGLLSDTIYYSALIGANTPPVYAGPDDSSCEQSSFTVSGAQDLGASSVSWSTSGDGTFTAGSTTLTPTYAPGPSDVATGSVTLTMTALMADSSIETDVLVLTINSDPEAEAGSNMTICESESANLSGTASNYSTIVWSRTGDGTFSDAANLNTIYYPGTNDRLSGTANITLTALPIAPCTTNATSNLQITISPLPTVNAGSNITNCGQAEIQLNGIATHYSPSSIVWSGGTGSFNSTSILNAKYTPSADDVTAGTVTLTLTVSGQSPCNTNISDNIAIVLREPAVNAGGDVLGCNGEALIVSNSTARDVTIVWSSSGTGTFDDNSVVNPTYHPSANDYLHPPILLTMTGTAVAPCTGTIVDQMQILSFIESPTVFSGYDTTICQTGNYVTIYASSSEASSVQWSTGGNGSFGGNQNQLQATYTPGTLDISRGYADLTLRAYPNSPCANQVTHSFRLSIQRLPVVSAGNDESVCEGSSIQITTASVSYYNNIQWTTNGSGTFSNTTVLNPTYYPSAADIVSGVVLTLTATSNNPCSGSISDSMTLTGVQEPEGNAGADAYICETNTYYLGDATASHYSNLVWTTSGDGSFSSSNILHPTYTPGTNDISSGSATLELTIVARTPCTSSIVDALTLTFAAAPIIEAGSNVAICAGSTYTTNASVANHTSFEWTTSGDGSFVNSTGVNKIYTPGPLDIINGSAVLTLTATGITPCEGDFTDNFTLTIYENPTVNAGPDETICSTAFTLTNASVNNYSTISWSSDGSSGTITNGNTLTPTYTASSSDILRGYVNLTITANPILPCGLIATDQIKLDIQPIAVADAGTDVIICASDSYTVIGANVDNQSSYRWITSGSGTLLNATNNLSPTYTPSDEDIELGAVRLTLIATPIAPCSSEISDEMFLIIEPLPIVDAGSNSSVCENGSFTAIEARVENYSSFSWSSSGDGVFINPNVLNAIYTPGATDLINGSFRLTLSAQSNSPCSTTITDFLDVSIVNLPTANAGPDVSERCSGDSYTITGASATNYSSINWTTSGSGTITNANSLNPTYTLAENDALLGTVTLTMVVTGKSPCNVTVSDAILMYVIPDVIVFAGTDFSICEGSSFTITDATATNHSALSWSSSGTGVFANQNTITPTYTPSSEDIAAGSVNLILTGTGNSLCSEKSDNIIVTINKNPIVNAGTTTDICSVPSLIQGATAQHYQSLSWSSSGTGIFNFGNTLTPTYTPSAVDVASGVITFTLTATPNNPCSTNTTSSIQVNIHQAPLISAGDDATVCEGETYSLITASSANVTNRRWTTSGTGVFADPNIANTVYTPSAYDATLGNVTLTLTGGNLTCTDESDYMVLTVRRMPQVYAGKDSTLCENGSYVVRDAVIRNYSSLLWTHNGTGTLTGAITISPVYTAGSGDISAGSVTLNVAVTSASPCVGITNDVLTLTIKHLPTSYAGLDTTICETENYVIVGAAATDYESVSWSSAGTGTFLHRGTLTPTYFPSQEDINRGNVVLRMHVSNSPCNIVTDQMTLSFGLLPQANAGFDAGVNFGTTFGITSSSVSNNNGLLWTTSGTGTFSSTTTLHPTYTPSAQDFAVGHVVLTLTAYGISPCGQVSDEMILTITDNPDVAFTWENACVSTIMQFLIDRDLTDVNSIVSWNWDFGDGNTSTLMEPTHLYSNSGTYAVSLTVVDVNNYTSKITNDIVISPLPVANFNYTSPSCSNLATVFSDFSNTSVGHITEWHYTFGDGTEQTITFPENPNITHSYASYGTYNVLLTVTSSVGCSNSISKNIVVVPSPEASFSMNAYCLSGSAHFEDLSQDNSGGAIIEWLWNFGDPDSGINNSSTLQHPAHLYENTGTYNVSLQITNVNGCTSTSTQSFDIVIQEEVDFYYTGSTCINNSKQFFINTDIVNMINVQTIEWDFGDGSPFSTAQNPTHTYTTTGVFNVTLSINNNGCESSVTYAVTVHPTPTSIFDYSNTCAKSLTEFVDRSSIANYFLASWSWDFGDPIRSDDYSTLQNASYGYTESGFYTVSLTVTDENGCSDTSQESVEIFPSPTSAFTFENNYENTQGRILLINESVGAIEYDWIFGDGGASTEENPIYSYMEDGNYTIELYSWNTYNCSDTSTAQYELLFKGLYIPTAFSPNNPNEDISKFKAIGINLMTFHIAVYDSWGTIVWESDLLDENGSPSEEWDGVYKGNLLPQGVYAWKARAVFLDGSIWEGKDLGNNAGGSGKPSGTITLIR